LNLSPNNCPPETTPSVLGKRWCKANPTRPEWLQSVLN
jgi:hypothetical protein